MASLGLSFPSAMCCPRERPPVEVDGHPDLKVLAPVNVQVWPSSQVKAPESAGLATLGRASCLGDLELPPTMGASPELWGSGRGKDAPRAGQACPALCSKQTYQLVSGASLCSSVLRPGVGLGCLLC